MGGLKGGAGKVVDADAVSDATDAVGFASGAFGGPFGSAGF